MDSSRGDVAFDSGIRPGLCFIADQFSEEAVQKVTREDLTRRCSERLSRYAFTFSDD